MPNENGGRMQLRLVDSAANRARYSVELTTSDGTWCARADVDSAGEVRIEDFGDAAPRWLVESVRVLLRGVARSAGSGARLGPASSWPRRIQRWRGQP